MDDLDDDYLEGDSDCDEALETHSTTGLESIPSSDEAVEQADSLPGPSGLQSSSRLQSPPLTGPASPPLLTPASPPPLQPQFPTQSRQGEARQSRPLPPSPNQSRRGRAQPTRPASPSQTWSQRVRAQQSVPPPPSQPRSRRGRAQPSRPASPSQTRSQRVRAQQSVPPPPSQPRSRRGRAQPSRPAGEESRDEWSSEPSDITVQPFMMDVGPTFQLSSDPTEVFLKFFTPELIDHIVQETNRYAALCLSAAANTSHPVTSWETNSDEIRAYLGFNILMGLNHLPELYDYWSLDECYHYFPIASRISRKRFMEIQKFLHFTDNTTIVPHGEPGYDRLARVRPVIDAVQDTFLTNYHPHRDNAIDEAMIKFKGRSAMKQYLPLKPTKRGFKVWVRADSVIGYISDFEVYTGKSDAPEKYLGEKVVKKLTRPLVGGNYHTYCDNYFTTVSLFEDLLEDGIYACGTFRRDRRGIPEALKQPGNCCLQADRVICECLDVHSAYYTTVVLR